jgi:hypothetical protein
LSSSQTPLDNRPIASLEVVLMGQGVCNS